MTDAAGGVLARRRARREERVQARLAKIRAKSGARYRIHYDIDGPRVRLGVAWFVGAMVAFALGGLGLAVYYGLAAGAAAAHGARAWRARGRRVEPVVALAGGFAVVGASAVGPQAAGAVLLVAVAVCIAASALRHDGAPSATIVASGFYVQVVVPPALAGACLVLLADLDLSAALSLIVLISAYEAGDFLIGSGSANAVEGPLAGLVAVALFSFVIGAFGVFTAAEAAALGAAAGVGAILGQLLASAMLPHSRAHAPALRRLDSLLLAAPCWYAAVDLALA